MALMAAVKLCGGEVLTLDAVPFDPDIPAELLKVDPDRQVILYGSTNFVNQAWGRRTWKPGAWYDPVKFSCRAYQDNWGEAMVNSDALFTTFAEFQKKDFHPDRLFFVRPESDLKEFAGEVVQFGSFQKWRMMGLDPYQVLSEHTRIIASAPVNILLEWRCFMVNGKCVAGSQYRKHFDLCVSATLPKEVRDFAEAQAAKWSPAKIFVLDVAQCNPSWDDLYIVEAGCVNSAGFYASNIEAIVTSIHHAISA